MSCLAPACAACPGVCADYADFPIVDMTLSSSLNPALIAQHDRLLKLKTPLGNDILLPQRVLAHERLGRSYDYTVDAVAVQDDIDLKKLIAQPVTLWIQQEDRSYLPVSGYVHTAKRLGSDGQLTYCQIALPRGCIS